MKSVLIFPNSLFEKNNLLDSNTTAYIIEHNVYFSLYKYHKLKLILHRASMKYYAEYIKNKYKCKVKYIDHNKVKKNLSYVFNKINNNNIEMYDPVDHLVIEDINKQEKKYKKNVIIHETKLFITPTEELENYFNENKNNHKNFYIWQRKKYNILMKKNKPIGNKWSYDVYNREKFNDDIKNDKKKNYIPNINTNKYIDEAKKYVIKNFKNNPGSTNFYLPITHNESKKHLKNFIKNRLKCFGPYQDAVDIDIPFGCHSLLSPLLNIGLLTPKYVIKELEDYGINNKIPLPSLEGIIRQIIGWREYVRMFYICDRANLENNNHYNHNKKLKRYWFTGKNTSDIIVIDDLIKKTIEYGYLHHIERLMYIGNFMLINKIYPQDVFKWFMSLFVDSYNWVMYPNVYGMSQYSSKSNMMTRPYFSSSNYIIKMSNYNKSSGNKIILDDSEYSWHKVWDSLYYNFINDNKKELKKNYATSMQVVHWTRKTNNEKNEMKKIADLYMKKY